MPRTPKGCVRFRDRWRVFVRVNGRLRSKVFKVLDPAKMNEWRDKQKAASAAAAAGSIAADVDTYLADPTIAAQAYVHHKARHLEEWLKVLGRDRSRADVTHDEVETEIQRRLKIYAPATVYHVRSALLDFFKFHNAEHPDAPNPVQRTTCPKSWTPRDQSVDFDILRQAHAAMADYRYIAKGIRVLSVAKAAVGILINAGLRPVDLSRVARSDINWHTASVLVPGTRKGKGTDPWTLELSADGLAAFRVFDAAKGYKFKPEAVSHSFKRAVRKVVGHDTPIHLYCGRHSIGKETYAITKDLDTVRRNVGHAVGSRATVQYTIGAHAQVNRAAVEGVAAARRAAVAVHEAAEKLHTKLHPPIKSRKRNKLRRVG